VYGTVHCCEKPLRRWSGQGRHRQSATNFLLKNCELLFIPWVG